MIYPHYDLSACETALRGARARTPARPALCRVACVLSFVVTILLLSSCNIRAAFADGGGGGGHAFQTPRILQLWEGSELRVVGGLSSGFDAAALLIGYSISDTNSLTLDQRKLLSNPNTGGRFYELSTRFRSYASTGNPIGVAGVDVPNPGASVWAEVIDGFANFEYTPTTTWWCQAATSFVNGAREDYDAILSGQGGGGGNETDDYVQFIATQSIGEMLVGTYGNLPNYYPASGVTAGIRVPKNSSTYTSMSNFYNSGLTYIYVVNDVIFNERYYSYDYRGFSYLIMSDKPLTLSFSDEGPYGISSKHLYYVKINVTGGGTARARYLRSWGTSYQVDSTNFLIGGSSGNISSSDASITNDTISGNIYGAWFGGPYGLTGGGGQPTIPEDNNWPEDEPEPVPDPPVVPDPPSDPVTPQPPIDPINPQDPIVVGDNPTQVGGTDYTAYLQQIIDDLAAHCQHLQSMMVAVGEYLGTYIANLGDSIGSWFQWLAQYLGSEFRKTRQYLNELFEWLADQFSFESEPYNDSNMLYWLRQLYGQLGRGFGSRPLDPLQNTDYTGQWLDVYFDTTLDSLNADSSALSTRFTTALNRVITKFPVSIPWDVLSILNLLVASPVTPVVDVPMFTVGANGLESSTPLHIDLSSYDSAMAVVRYMFKLTFVVYCLMHTRDMMYFIGGLLGGSYD